MSKNKYIISFTTIPTRLKNIHFTIDSLLNQLVKPEKIILNVPKIYSLRFKTSIDIISVNELLKKYQNKIIINYVDEDYGPGTKLLGLLKNNIIDINVENLYIMLLDDDMLYPNGIIQSFNNHINKKKSINIGSYNIRKINDIQVAYGSSVIFLKANKLNKFIDYYNIIKEYDLIKYHDDIYISYYFIINNHTIHKIHYDKEWNFNKKATVSSDITALKNLDNNFNRKLLNKEVPTILKNLNKEGKFDSIKYDNSTYIINKHNCEIITTTLSNNKISQLRKKNIINNFEKKMGFNIHFIEGTQYTEWTPSINHKVTLNQLEKFKTSGKEYGLLCQDDFYPIDNFLDELHKTVELLPKNWECLHLAPGFLWGRRFRDKTKIGHLNPEYNMDKDVFNYHSSGRFFMNCNPDEYYKLKGWLGGPVAFILKHKHLTKFLNEYKKNIDNDDKALVKILNKNTFIAREPQLGYEEECGSTSLNK